MNNFSKVEVGNNLRDSIKEVVDSLGGFSHFISQGEVVLIKPNFNTADPFPASTDISFLKEVISLIYSAGAKAVIVGESSTYSRNTRKEMEKLGVFDLEKETPAPKIYVFEEREWIKKEIPEGKYLKKVTVPKILDKVDKLILLPCLKTHSYAQFTGALKLSVGFMKPWERIPMHLKNLQEKIAELNRIINPDLIIMDGRKCFINQGPSKGEVREPGIILASTDRAVCDIAGIKIIQSYAGNSLKNVVPEEVVQIKNFLEEK
ncbi:MAG TPA: DUF362 domain-containing protein [Ignavibacteria bacterium]|nr:DUF362 domain-containing protein [Ignavibacteria bacterium]